MSLRKEIGFEPYISASYYSVGLVYLNLKMYKSAIEAFSNSIKMAEKVGFIQYTILPLIKLGDVFSAKGNYIEAKKNYVEAIKAASKNKYTDKGIDELIEKIIAIEKYK